VRRKSATYHEVIHELTLAHRESEKLNQTLLGTFDEKRIFRIDHYLGKRPVQNMLFLRFTNAFLEPFWNRNHIQSVQNHHGRKFRRPGPRFL